MVREKESRLSSTRASTSDLHEGGETLVHAPATDGSRRTRTTVRVKASKDKTVVTAYGGQARRTRVPSAGAKSAMPMVSTRVYQFRSFAQRLRVIPCNIVPGCRCWRSFTVAPAQGTCTGEERAAFNFCICWTAEPARNMREKNINNRTEPNLPGYDTVPFGCRVV